MMKHCDFGISLMLGKCLHWLESQITRIINRKKDALAFQKLGATFELETKVVWVKMLEVLSSSKSMSMMKTKSNVILEQTLAMSKNGFILSVTHDGDQTYKQSWFDINGNMHHSGRAEFWREFSKMIHDFDTQKEHLLSSYRANQFPQQRLGQQVTLMMRCSLIPPHRMGPHSRPHLPFGLSSFKPEKR